MQTIDTFYVKMRKNSHRHHNCLITVEYVLNCFSRELYFYVDRFSHKVLAIFFF